jgi:5-methylcytosine-specific restriction endonuclease McrA
MTTRTLLLSSGYEPLNTITWKKALCLLSLGKAEIVEEYDDQQIRTSTLVLKVPAVVRLVNMFRRHKQRVRYRKQNVFARDRWTCQYCGVKASCSALTVDHVVPRAQGGKTEWDNVTTSCQDCNATKADRTPAQAKMKLRSKPFRPDWVPILTFELGREQFPEAWKTYLVRV